MKFKQNDFIRLDNGIILHVIYADKEKIVCLKILKNPATECYYYAESSKIISNKETNYKVEGGFEVIAPISINECTLWEPLVTGFRYNY
ncbi:MAG: hypothetical protein ACI4DP_03425 [Candidatus Ornithomonoglobus sp.]